MLGKAAKQAKAQNYPEACGVNVADRWKERLRSYLGYYQQAITWGGLMDTWNAFVKCG